MAQATTDYDIVVIGGGIAGIYSAWRLLNADAANPNLLKKWKKKGNKLRIAIYEGSERTGGRIMTCTPPNFS
ncbi:MAG: NAD(P)-binding protein, partial [Flavobacteriales bacterium]